MSDQINPSHYKRLPAEAIEIIEAAIENAPSNQDAYLHGQVLKYVLRCWDKNGIEDLKKAKWYLDRLIDSFDTEPDSVVKQDLKTEKWKPKIGDWVKINKPQCNPAWMPGMDQYDGQIVEVKEIDDEPSIHEGWAYTGRAIVHDEWCFLFEWLEPAEAPLNSDKIPKGYRKLDNAWHELRQIGDLRWSVTKKRYVQISQEEIFYANSQNWAACRRVTQEVKPPDGWRWIENGEVLRRGDRRYKDFVFWDLEARYVGVNASDAFDTKFIRRNRFNVGEKVVYTIDGSIWTYKSEIDDGPRFPKSAWVTRHGGVSQRTCVNHLAPYIEDAK